MSDPKIRDTDFMGKLDSNPSLLPIKNNKVFDLRTREIRDRTKDDMFSYSLDVEYTKNQQNAKRFFSELTTEVDEKICSTH